MFDAFKRLRTRRCRCDDLLNSKTDPFDENVTQEEMDSFTRARLDLELAVKFLKWTRTDTLRRPGLDGDRHP